MRLGQQDMLSRSESAEKQHPVPLKKARVNNRMLSSSGYQAINELHHFYFPYVDQVGSELIEICLPFVE